MNCGTSSAHGRAPCGPEIYQHYLAFIFAVCRGPPFRSVTESSGAAGSRKAGGDSVCRPESVHRGINAQAPARQPRSKKLLCASGCDTQPTHPWLRESLFPPSRRQSWWPDTARAPRVKPIFLQLGKCRPDVGAMVPRAASAIDHHRPSFEQRCGAGAQLLHALRLAYRPNELRAGNVGLDIKSLWPYIKDVTGF